MIDRVIRWGIVLVILAIVAAHHAAAAPVRIGPEARVLENPRSQYNRFVNWRPYDGEVVRLNPPRISWPYRPDWPNDWNDSFHVFRFQISAQPDCASPVVDVTCPFNFYNTIPELKGAKQWYWRVGYDIGASKEKWSPVRSFTLADDALVWDRSLLAGPPLAQRGHPRVLFNADNLDQIRGLARTNADSAAALDSMRVEADKIIKKPWWNHFPKTDREAEPQEQFHSIAEDLATVCFVWKMTGDAKYVAVKDHAVAWAGYPPGGRSSPEGLGGDGNEDATQGNEFLALLFDWLYQDLAEPQRQIMIRSLEWRVDHIMNRFSWRKKQGGSGFIVPAKSLSSLAESHQFESSMDTAVCGLVLYEHSDVGRQWFDMIVNYLIGVTCAHGFDEAWNEGPGYGPSKFKWLTNASLYFDTAIPGANFGKNPFYSRMGEFFSRIIPVGMPHNSWGNQANASRGNHLAIFRKLACLTGNGRFLYNWKEYGGGKKYLPFRPWIDYVLPYYYKEPAPEPEADPVGLFPIDGWGTAATGAPSDAKTFAEGVGMALQCRPRGGFGHSFNSDNSFILHAYGQMLNHGGGSSANQDAYAYHTMSHNTLLVDGLGQAEPPKGQLYPEYGRIVGFSRGDGAGGGVPYVYFAGDATRCYPAKPDKFRRWGLPIDAVYEKRALPYFDRFVRHVLFVRGQYFVIFDDLSCSQPATYTWLYHILPNGPLQFDPKAFTVDYSVGNVKVRLQQIAHPADLTLDDRKGLDAFVNPLTGEDYRQSRKKGPLCAHNLWVSTAQKQKDWNFLAVVYPAKPGTKIPAIERIDDMTVRVGDDVLCFDPAGPAASQATILVDPAALRPPGGSR